MPRNLAQSPTRAVDRRFAAEFEQFGLAGSTDHELTLGLTPSTVVHRMGALLHFVRASRVGHLVKDYRFSDLCRIDSTQIT
jgi:hypothetical protein